MCRHCDAQIFKNKTPGMCYANGKIKVKGLNPSPEPLLSIFFENSVDLKHFAKHSQIQFYISYDILWSQPSHPRPIHTTIKIQGQIFHRVGSLLPTPDSEHKFLQVYFMDDENVQIDQRCNCIPGIKRYIIPSLQKKF